jgi:hypothetical protein
MVRGNDIRLMMMKQEEWIMSEMIVFPDNMNAKNPYVRAWREY